MTIKEQGKFRSKYSESHEDLPKLETSLPPVKPLRNGKNEGM
jgi:hypothetical protein